MIFLKIFSIQFIFSADEINSKQIGNLGLVSEEYAKLSVNKPYNSLSELFKNFISIASREFTNFNCLHFNKLLSIINSYPYVNEQNHDFTSLHGSNCKKGYFNVSRTIFGHYYLTEENVKCLDSYRLKFKSQLSQEDYQYLKNLMKNFRGYGYSNILRHVGDEGMLHYITLTSLLENIGITYLKLLSKNPYYKIDKLFVRDFITNSACILHSVNMIYKIGLANVRLMNLFKVFAVKNLKLLCIFWNIWNVSYSTILLEMNNPNKSIIIDSPKFNVTTSRDPKTGEVRCLKLYEFNHEIQLLFRFILKIDLDLDFKNEFEILKTPKNFNSLNLHNMVQHFDAEGILNFFTGHYEHKFGKCKSPDYFLNSLNFNIPRTDDILTITNKNLFFILHKNIKSYFEDMLLVVHTEDIEDFQKLFKFFSTKRSHMINDILKDAKRSRKQSHPTKVLKNVEQIEPLKNSGLQCNKEPNFVMDGEFKKPIASSNLKRFDNLTPKSCNFQSNVQSNSEPIDSSFKKNSNDEPLDLSFKKK